MSKNAPMLSEKSKIHRVFHALGDSTRRAIMETLSEGPISVSALLREER
jgi:DNA-binding transcriptional ArsR family regulator